jgi:hypothetical protein
MADQRVLTASALPSLDKSHHPEAYQEAEHNMGGWIPLLPSRKPGISLAPNLKYPRKESREVL